MGLPSAPHATVQFLINSTKSAFPNFISDWDGMIETLCRAGSPLETIKLLLQTHQTSFSDQRINWQKGARELTICCLLRCGHSLHQDFPSIWGGMIQTFGALQLHSELMQYLQEIQQRLFPDINNADWQMVCEEFIQPFNNP